MSLRKAAFAGDGGSLTLQQLWTMIRANRRFCFALAVLSAAVTLALGLTEVPYFVSTAKIQFKGADTGKTLVQTALNETDSLPIREFIDHSIGVIRSDPFRDELAAVVKSSAEDKHLVLAWAVGLRTRLQYGLNRLGLGDVYHQPIDLTALSKEEIAGLLEKMIDIGPDYKEQSADINITALDPHTAEAINQIVLTALIHTNDKIKTADLSRTTDFLEKQREEARRKLVEANDNLRLFYQENPELMSAGGKGNASDERSDILAQRSQLTDDIASNKKLLAFFKKEYMSFTKDSDTTAEVYDKFKQELIELKYKRKKYIFQGYDEKNDGIVEIDHRISEIEKILSSGSHEKPGEDHLVGVGHEQSLSDKIMELQDTIKKQEFEMESISSRLGKASTKSEQQSRALLLLDNLKVEVKLATSLFEDLSKKSEYAHMRKNGDDQQILVKEAPSLPTRSNGLPIALRVFFGAFVGLALAVSWLILSSVLSFLITDEQSVESLGIGFVGVLREHEPDLSQILMNLDCLDKPDGAETHIVLCTSPGSSVHHEDLQLMTAFLARQKEKSLFIVVGETRIHPRFQPMSDLGFASVYAHPNDMEFVLKISEKETIKSLRDCVQILEETYRLRYGCVFLYFVKGVDDPNYHVGLKVASKILLLGAPAKHTSAEYYKLVYGLRDLKQTNFAFAEVRRSRRRRPSHRTPYENFLAEASFPPPLSTGEKIKKMFFD